LARNPVPPVMRKFLPPRNSATPIPSAAVVVEEAQPRSEKANGGLHATPPTLPCRRVNDAAVTSTPRRPRPAAKPGRTARDRLPHDELPMPAAARPPKRAAGAGANSATTRVNNAGCGARGRQVVSGWVLRRGSSVFFFVCVWRNCTYLERS
jgi:hypothetical protein